VADVAAVGCTRGDQSRLSTMGYSSRSVRCRGRNYATLSLFTMQWMRTRCQSKLNDDKYLGTEGVVGTKRAFTAVRHHEEVAAARCLGVTASISASTIPHSSSSSELSLEDSEDGDS
jgi:hypothetical protein